MTVSYQYEVASSTSGGFTRLLFMWRGSLYKLIYRELLLFLAAFGVLSALYRNAFTEEQKRQVETIFPPTLPCPPQVKDRTYSFRLTHGAAELTAWPLFPKERLFEKMVVYCDTFINLIPLSFVLGFYVAYVAGRWWQQYMAIPWPDKIMHSIALYVNGNDEHGRILRRTMMRYLNLTLILVLRSISSAVKRRFPTLEHLVEAGFMTTIELEMYSSVPSVEFNTYWIPCTWFISLLKDTKKSNRISDSQGLKIIMEEFNEFRSKCGLLWSYDWVSLPLVYTQVVTIATYSFFLAALVGRQYVEVASRKKDYQMEVDIYIPVFTILQFFFYMGLLKVAEQLINPFGDDDEDFELNWLIDRHTKVAYLGVDTLMARQPPLVKDKYFDDVDLTLPYTEASVAYKKKTYRGSVHNMQVPEEKHTMFLPEITEEDEDRSCPTPKGSVHNLQAAAAAGIWRSRPSSSSSLFKLAENMESDTVSIRYMEDGLVSPSAVQVSEVNCRTPVREVPTKTSTNDSERKPSLTLTQWPSSSTLYKSESLRMSEVSIDMEVPLTPKPEKHHSFSGGEFLGLKSDITSHNLSESKLNINRKRAIAAKIKSLPKLVPVKRHSSFGGCVGNSRSKKGVRWKPMIDSTKMKSSDFSESERDRDNDSPYLKFNCLESPDVRFKSLDFPVPRIPEQVIICEVCRRRVQRISVSPYPEMNNCESYLKHSLSAPNVAYPSIEIGYNRNRSHSWQYKVMDTDKPTVKKDLTQISGGLKNRDTSISSTLFSQSTPNVAFLGNSLHLELPRPKTSSVPTTPEETEEHVSSLFQPGDLAKTSAAPNLDLEMDSSSPPTTISDAHDTSQEAASWKSADWTTLLGNDFKTS